MGDSGNKIRLILMRHGEAAASGNQGGDRERHLTESGKRVVDGVGKRLQKSGWVPDQIISSASVRTQETVRIIQSSMGLELHPVFSEGLYLGGIDQLIAESQHISLDCKTLLCVGHNPGFSDAVFVLSRQVVGLSPAGVALMDSSTTSWVEALCNANSWRLIENF